MLRHISIGGKRPCWIPSHAPGRRLQSAGNGDLPVRARMAGGATAGSSAARGRCGAAPGVPGAAGVPGPAICLPDLPHGASFELIDANLARRSRGDSLLQLSRVPEFRRGHGALCDALADGHLGRNPGIAGKAPKLSDEEPEPYTIQEGQRLLKVASERRNGCPLGCGSRARTSAR